jgi:methionine--tRNA ligase beta chain
MATYDDFSKLELKTAKVVSAEKVEGSEKLLKLKILLGDEERQIIAGIGKSYQSEELVGKTIVVIANLEPKKLMGLESQGMLLAVSADSGPVLLMPDKEVESGLGIK